MRGSQQSYIVTCGQFSTIIEIDETPYEKEEDVYMEVASQALENYFNFKITEPLSDFTTVLNTKETNEDESFVIMTKYIFINIGRQDLVT